MPEFFRRNNSIVCGCDEAGRGCLAGPVVAAAVILPDDFEHPLLNDSKKVSVSNRDLLAEFIQTHALGFAIGVVTHEEIDRINILKASILAMHRAIEALPSTPEHIIVDGNRFYSYQNIPHECFVKGDARFTQISAASILAKTHRDKIMSDLHHQFPDYKWNENMGYPTIAHRAAIQQIGVSPFHRLTFRLLKDSPPELFD